MTGMRMGLALIGVLLLVGRAEGQRRKGAAEDTLSPKGDRGGYGTSVAPPVKISEAQERRWREESALVAGVVTDAQTGVPVGGVLVMVNPGFSMEVSDSAGAFAVEYLAPGRRKLVVERRGFLPLARVLEVRAGDSVRVDMALERAPAPCCTLDGTWEARFVLRTPAEMGPAPTDSVVTGTITFADSIPDPFRRRGRPDPYVAVSHGLSELDFSPFFGGRIARDVSTTVFGGTGSTFDREATGVVFNGDSVDVTLIPRISHGGVSMEGAIEGDVIRGRWIQRAYAGGATGVFELRRARARR